MFHAWHQPLADYVERITRSQNVTEEVVQEVFIKLWMKRELLRDVENIGAYLYRLSRNHTLNSLRQLAAERSKQKQLVDSGALIADEDAPSEQYFQLIEEAVNQLPAQQQKAWRLSREQGLAHKQIAEEMGLALNTVKRHIKMALRTITDHIRQHGDKGLLFIFLLFQELKK